MVLMGVDTHENRVDAVSFFDLLAVYSVEAYRAGVGAAVASNVGGRLVAPQRSEVLFVKVSPRCVAELV